MFERDIHTSESGFDCGLDRWGYVPNVYVINADGTGVRRLRSVDLWVEDGEPAWSPDGRFIAFSTLNTGLYVIDKDGAYAAEPVTADVQGIGFSPVWSPDSKKLLVVSAGPSENRLVIVDLASFGTSVLSLPAVSGRIQEPAWSR